MRVLNSFTNFLAEFRKQFDDQIKCMDSRLESKTFLVADVQEFMRKRSEIELEYSKNLERLSDRFSDRFQRQRNTYGLSQYELFTSILFCIFIPPYFLKQKNSCVILLFLIVMYFNV